MAVHSSQVPLGTPIPEQVLPDLTGLPHFLPDLRGEGVLVVAFTCNHCPYVRHIEHEFGAVAAEYPNVSFAAICSNDVVAYPDDDVPGLTEQKDRAGWSFPYLIDREQNVARQFGAVCTPDLFVYDINGNLGYRGAFDDSTPGNGQPVTGNALRGALDLLLQTKPVPEPQRPSMGCSIKWRQ